MLENPDPDFSDETDFEHPIAVVRWRIAVYFYDGLQYGWQVHVDSRKTNRTSSPVP